MVYDPLSAADENSVQTFPLPLQQFEAAIQVDQRVLGMLYTGSLGRGNPDRFSDLDIEFWLTDAALAEARTTVQEILGYLGVVQFLYARETIYTGFVGRQWQPVDLRVHPPAEALKLPAAIPVRIVKDTQEHVERALARVERPPIDITWEAARMRMEDALDSLVYLSRPNARGEVWYAIGKLTTCAIELYRCLAALRGRESYDYRYAERVLSADEQALLRQAWPAQPEQQEIRRAARALWGWTRYVWQEAERHLGRSLQLQVDEASLLAALDQLYDG